MQRDHHFSTKAQQSFIHNSKMNLRYQLAMKLCWLEKSLFGKFTQPGKSLERVDPPSSTSRLILKSEVYVFQTTDVVYDQTT